MVKSNSELKKKNSLIIYLRQNFIHKFINSLYRWAIRTLKITAVVFLLACNNIEAKTVRVGIYDNPPKVGVDKSGKAYGIFIDIIEYIAEKEGWSIEYVYDTWDECLLSLEKGSIDLMPDVAFSEKRNKRFDFNKITVLSSWVQIYSRKGSMIMSIPGLEGKRIAVLKGSNQQQVCNSIREKFGLHFTLLELPDYEETITAVETGMADAVAVGRFYAYAGNNRNIVPTPLLLDLSTLHFAAPKGRYQELLFLIDEHLSEILNNGNSIYYQSLAKWLHEKPRFFIPEFVAWVFIIASFIILFLLIVSFIFKKQVHARTRELRERNQQLQSAFDELQAIEEKIKTSLQEKETLLQELYHRTKNNMSVICSLLSLKAKTADDIRVIDFAKDIESKILSMALVHRILYQSSDLSSIDLEKYIDEFLSSSWDSFPRLGNKIKFNFDIEKINILIDTAIPLSFILNELMTNACKHAFPEGTEGLIEISIHKKNNGLIQFSFSDNGTGVEKNFNFRGQKTFGLKMIFDIVEIQMEGKVEFVVNKGIKCIIEFPSTLYSRRI